MNYRNRTHELTHRLSPQSSTGVPVTLLNLLGDHLRVGNERVAVVHSNRQLTYAELDVWSDAIAHHLRRQGLRKGDLVAIALQRSFEFVASMLGILKAGGAYVPLDKSYPQERLNYLLRDSRTEFIICGGDEAGRRSQQGLKTTSTDQLGQLRDQ